MVSHMELIHHEATKWTYSYTHMYIYIYKYYIYYNIPYTYIYTYTQNPQMLNIQEHAATQHPLDSQLKTCKNSMAPQ